MLIDAHSTSTHTLTHSLPLGILNLLSFLYHKQPLSLSAIRTGNSVSGQSEGFRVKSVAEQVHTHTINHHSTRCSLINNAWLSTIHYIQFRDKHVVACQHKERCYPHNKWFRNPWARKWSCQLLVKLATWVCHFTKFVSKLQRQNESTFAFGQKWARGVLFFCV